MAMKKSKSRLAILALLNIKTSKNDAGQHGSSRRQQVMDVIQVAEKTFNFIEVHNLKRCLVIENCNRISRPFGF